MRVQQKEKVTVQTEDRCLSAEPQNDKQAVNVPKERLERKCYTVDKSDSSRWYDHPKNRLIYEAVMEMTGQ